MPAVILLLRTLFSSRLVGSLVQFLRRSLSSTFGHVGTALRYVWDRISSQESKEAILGCVLCLLNMHKKIAMSEGLVKKVQPFTIGTRITVPTPAESKCPDMSLQPSWQSRTLGNIPLQSSLQDRFSILLSQVPGCVPAMRQMPPFPQLVPLSKQTTRTAEAVREQEDEPLSTHLYWKLTAPALSSFSILPTASSRSVRKITISGSPEKELCTWRKPAPTDHQVVSVGPVMTHSVEKLRLENSNKNNNINNNNNNSSKSVLPILLDVSCDNKTGSPFKEFRPKASTSSKQTDTVKKQLAQNDNNMSHHTDLFNQEVPQTSDQLTLKMNPSSDLVKKQLSHVRDQWHSLKQRVAIQQRAVEESKTLQEFNRNVEKLETWIKEKVEQQALMKVLGNNPDKLQITRRILDIKQEEQLYWVLHEEINQLALTLENQGKTTETKNISTRRKHINKMWLKAQSILEDYHGHLQLAMEVASFYQQADNTQSAISNMRTTISLAKKTDEDREIRDIASQIMMLDVCASQLSNVHPALAGRVAVKQTEVKDSWSLLQKTIRTTRPPCFSSRVERQTLTKGKDPPDSVPTGPHSTKEPPDSVLTGLYSTKEPPDSVLTGPYSTKEPPDSVLTGPHSTKEPPDSVLTGPHSTKEPPDSVLTGPDSTMGRENVKRNSPSGIYDHVTSGDRSACVNDVVTLRKQTDRESRKQKAGPSRRGHVKLRLYIPEPHLHLQHTPHVNPELRPENLQTCPPLQTQTSLQPCPHFQTQLQKFTVSANKTLWWMKNNVVMATRVCSLIGPEAERLQDIIEQEIINNRDRIELVKKEGAGLVKSQHPSSSKIQDFLTRLDELWEELKRRHHRNHIYLQSEEQVVKVLQGLGSLEAWLQAVDMSMCSSQLAGNPETMELAERENCQLQSDLCARGRELAALRKQVTRLRCLKGGQGSGYPKTDDLQGKHGPGYPNTDDLLGKHGPGYPNTNDLQGPHGLYGRLEQVERLYQRVQMAVTLQSLSLQDNRMLTKFLERVELEENQDASKSVCNSSSEQPLHREISSASATLGDGRGAVAVPLGVVMGDGRGAMAVPLGAVMSDAVEELQEAVEMLNDTVRERVRSQTYIQDQAIQNLLPQMTVLTVHVEDRLCCSRELSQDVLQRETDMAVRCDPDGCGSGDLAERQSHLEADYAELKEEMEELQRQMCHLKELCPDRVSVFGVEIQETIRVWRELGRSMEETRNRIHECVDLQDFFRNYLAFILWTEDARACIFSERWLNCGHDDQNSITLELDMMDTLIDRKLEEFEELDATGRTLLKAEHHLVNMIHERLKELRSMLGWIVVHWRAQKQKKGLDMKNTEKIKEIIYSEPPRMPTANHSTADPIYSNTTANHSTADPIYFNTTPNHSTEDNIYTKSADYTTEDNIYTKTANHTTEDNIYTKTANHTTEDNIYTKTANHTTEDNIYTKTANHTTEDNIYTKTAVHTTEDNIYTKTANHTTDDNIYTKTAELPSKATVDNIYSEATAFSCLTIECHQPLKGTMSENLPLFTQQHTAEDDDYQVMNSDGYEVMNSVTELPGASSNLTSPETTKEHFDTDFCLGGNSVNSGPGVTLRDSVDLGGTVNLTFSLGSHGDSHVEVRQAGRKEEQSSEPVHRPTKSLWRRWQGLLGNTLGSLKRKRKLQSQTVNQVSTSLHVKENNMAAGAAVYESITLPRLHTNTSSCSSASSSGPLAPKCVSFPFPPTCPSSTSLSIFSSLKKSKKRKSRDDAQRHNIQRIMGVEGEDQIEGVCPSLASAQPITPFDTQTWPMKDGRKKKNQKSAEVKLGTGLELIDYMKNPLAKGVHDQGAGAYTISPYAETNASSVAPTRAQVRSHCRFLSLGSVLIFELPKEMRLVPSVQDIITIGLPEHRGGKSKPNPDMDPDRNTALSSFKQTRSPLSKLHTCPHLLPTSQPTSPSVMNLSPPQQVTQLQTPLKAQVQTQLQTQKQTLPQLQTQCQTQLQTQAPLQTQLQAQLQTLLQTQKQTPLQTELQTQLQMPIQTQLQTPIQAQLQTQLQTPLQSQLQTPLQTELETELETELQTQLQTQLQTPIQTQLQTQVQVQTPLQAQLQTLLQTELQTQLQTQLQTPIQTQLQTQLQTPLQAQLQTPLQTELQTQLQTQLCLSYLDERFPTPLPAAAMVHDNDLSDYQPVPSTDLSDYQSVPGTDLSDYQSVLSTDLSDYQSVPSTDLSDYQPVPSTDLSDYQTVPSTDLSDYLSVPSTDLSDYLSVPSTDLSDYQPVPSTDLSDYQPVPSTDLSDHQTVPSTDLSDHQTVPSDDISFPQKRFICVHSALVSQEPSFREYVERTVIHQIPQQPRHNQSNSPINQELKSSSGPQNHSSIQQSNQGSQMVVILKASGTDSMRRDPSLYNLRRFNVSEVLQPQKEVKESETNTGTGADPVHPDHHQFEELEEELEDIWNQTDGYRESLCSDIMYQPHQDEKGVGSCPPGPTTDNPSPSFHPAPSPEATHYRQFITSSAPDLLVAEFTLPAPLQTLLGYNQGQNNVQQPNPSEKCPTLGSRDRRSWAGFLNQDQPWRYAVVVNETALDSVKLPEIEDQQRYIYQYNEEVEKEDEEEREEKTEDTGCPKDQSLSLQSVHLGLDRANHRASLESDIGDRGHQISTGGSCNNILQSMEGPLEKKHKLQFGGKKAGSRAWSSHHAVLYKQTLCFYQDRKDTLRSSVCGLPLNLKGAVCVPAPEYTKKPHCFSVHLRDGSEYLLSTTSSISMNTWMLKIQANTEDIFGSVRVSGVSRGTSPFCPPQRRCSITSGQDSLRNRRRSQSFSSATYKQMKPVLPPPRGQAQDSKSSYSVTLVIGEKQSETARFNGFDTGPFTSSISDPKNQVNGWQHHSYQNSIKMNQDSYKQIFHQQDPAFRSYMSLPRPRNKSVFKRFFGKKDLS